MCDVLSVGCELAMMCDIIIASESAKFGQPEINLGVIPGAGGTQRLVRAIGKSKAMEMILTGNMINAEQAEKDGLISRVVKAEALLDDALKLGFVIGSKGQLSVRMAKEAINAADEMSLEQVKCNAHLTRNIFERIFHDNACGLICNRAYDLSDVYFIPYLLLMIKRRYVAYLRKFILIVQLGLHRSTTTGFGF